MDYQKMSKEISYALRHAPHEYELEMDEHGWVDVEQLLYALREQPKWAAIAEADLHKMISLSDKQRHEIKEGKIRAFYGHSVPQKIRKVAKEPPALLYHGTAQRFVSSILEKGLLPQGRQYVHLSEEIEIARQVGKRRDDRPVILRIEAHKAWQEGVAFYHGNERVWLADWVKPRLITLYIEGITGQATRQIPAERAQ